MLWSRFCKGDVSHIVKPGTVQMEEGRMVAITYCNHETSEGIDSWETEDRLNSVCGICYRAMRKKIGRPVIMPKGRKYRHTVINIKNQGELAQGS